MKRLQTFIATMLTLLLIAESANAVSIKGRDVSTIPDILRWSRGLTGKETSLELRKDSLIRIRADGHLGLFCNIGNGNNGSSLGNINNFASSSSHHYLDNSGLFLSLAKTTFNGNKVLIASPQPVERVDGSATTNVYYDLYFLTVGKNDNGEVSQSRFGAWSYPNEVGSGNSAYLKDIDTGIFLKGFDGELIVTASMTATNDNKRKPVNYSTKTVGTRLDFWVLFADEYGNVKYKKLDSLTQTKSGFETAPLDGLKNATDSDWSSKNNLSNTTATPYMIIKTATGDFNNDGYANEVAMLATDVNGIYLWIYQLEYKDNAFTIKTMKDKTTLFSYRYPDYFRKWSYNGWNRAPGADVLAGDFDGDGETEMAVIFQGDFPSGERNVMMFGGTVKTLHTNLYKWDNNTGDLKVTPHEVDDYDSELKEKAFTYHYYSTVGRHNHWFEKQKGYTRRLQMSWGGFTATVLDINGDGKDEIAFTGYRSDMFYKIKDADYMGYDSGRDRHAEYTVCSYFSLVKMDSDGKLKSSVVTKATPTINRRTSRYNGRGYDDTDNLNAFNLQEYLLAPFAKTDVDLFSVIDRDTIILSGAFYGQTGIAKERDDLAIGLFGKKINIFKSDGSTLISQGYITAEGRSAIIAADFAGEGIELGNPTFITRPKDKTYMAVIQAPPFHVDTVTEDGTDIQPKPVNYSYTKGAQVKYGHAEANTQVQMTKFDVHSTVETIFAMDSDTTRNIIGGAKTAQKVYGAIKGIASIIPGTSKFENVVAKAKAVDGAASAVFGFLDKITDKVETIKTGFDKELTTSKTFSAITAMDQDTFALVQADQYIWRYPIVTKPAPNLGTMSNDAKYLTKQDFISFTIYGDRTASTKISASEYQPTHENGNLFSYPTRVGNIEGYAHRQKELSYPQDIQFGADFSGYSKFEKVTTNEKTESKKVTTGYLSDALSLVDSIFNTNLAKVPDGEQGPTYTRTEDQEEEIRWEIPRVASSPLDGGYTLHYQAYVAENGAVTCGFGVSDFKTSLNLFNSSSLYSTKADPAFPLPHKFKMGTNASGELPEFVANPSREEAMEIRGARFYAKDFNRYTSSRLLKGATYRVEIPIYNASFKAVDNVKVNLYWTTDRKPDTAKTLIGTQYVNLKGWSNEGDNKATLEFEFTPNMAANAKGQHYQLYAEIDPDGSIEEVHEKRSVDEDSGGNNEGYIEFSVETVESAQATAAFYASDFKASFSEEDIVFPVMTFGGYSTWAEFFNAKIANADGPVELPVTIENKMDLTIPRVEIIAVYFDPELWESQQEIGCAHFARDITLFPNETYSYTFTIPGNVVAELKKVGVENTSCSYTPRSLFELIYGTESEPGLIGDSDPDLGSSEGTVSKDEEVDTTRYYTTVYTQSYELSHDVPVFWRIEGIADVVPNTTDGEVFAKSDITEPATQEDFTIAWSPTDVSTAKTDSIHLTISTIPNVTRAGQYAFTVQISEDGETWTDKEALIFGTEDSGSFGGVSASSGGCDVGYSAVMLMLLVVGIRRKKR